MKIKNTSISVFSTEKHLNQKFLAMKFLKGNKMVSVKGFLLVKIAHRIRDHIKDLV